MDSGDRPNETGSGDRPMKTTIIPGILNRGNLPENFKDLIIQKDKPSGFRSPGRFMIDTVQRKDSRGKVGESKILYFQMVRIANAGGKADEKGFNETNQKYAFIKFTLKTEDKNTEKVVINEDSVVYVGDEEISAKKDFLSINNPIYNNVQEQLKNLKISMKRGEDAKLHKVDQDGNEVVPADPTTNMNVEFEIKQDDLKIKEFKIYDPEGNNVVWGEGMQTSTYLKEKFRGGRNPYFVLQQPSALLIPFESILFKPPGGDKILRPRDQLECKILLDNGISCNEQKKLKEYTPYNIAGGGGRRRRKRRTRRKKRRTKNNKSRKRKKTKRRRKRRKSKRRRRR